MTDYSYNNNIPFASHNPSSDQPLMLENTNNTDLLINEDHFSFNQNNGGLHKQARLVNEATPSAAIRDPGMGTIYTKQIASESQLFYIPDKVNIANEYQLTRAIDASFASFRTNPGWSFLPGGLLIQWGFVDGTHTGSSFNIGDRTTPLGGTYPFVTFSVPYTLGVFNVMTSLSFTSTGPGIPGTGSVDAVTIDNATLTTAGFNWYFSGSNSGQFTKFYWTAIGL